MAGGRGRRRAAAAAAALVVALCLLGSRPAVAASPSPSPGPSAGGGADQVVLLGRVVVARGESVGEVVIFSGRALIEGVVRGDVVVASGPIVVSGQVSGSVIALDGSIHLLPTAQVGGDALARDDVILDEGAHVGGSARQDVRFTLSHPLRALGAFISWAAVACSMLVLGLVFAFLAPRGLVRTAIAARTAPWASTAWGVGLAVAIPILAVAAVASVAGLPLGLAMLLALAFVVMLGAVITAHAVGRALVGDARHTALAYLAGWGVLTVIGLVPYVSGIVFLTSSVFGLGASVVALWRARDPGRGGRHRVGATTSPAAPSPLTGADAPGL